MTAEELVKAIKHLKPNAHFSFKENDYSSIVWHKIEGDAPSFNELENALKEVKIIEEKQLAELLAKKTAAEAKLSALGLSLDDLKALGLG